MSRSPSYYRHKQKSQRAKAMARANILAALRSEGARCQTCKHIKKNNPILGLGKSHHCALHSDSDGYSVIEPSDLCTDWKQQDHRHG